MQSEIGLTRPVKRKKKENKLLHRPKTVKCTVKRVTAGHLERSIDPMNTFRMIDAPSQYAGSFFQNRRLELLPVCGDKSPIFSSSGLLQSLKLYSGHPPDLVKCTADFDVRYPRQFSKSGFSIAHLCRSVRSASTPCGQQCAANGSRKSVIVEFEIGITYYATWPLAILQDHITACVAMNHCSITQKSVICKIRLHENGVLLPVLDI
ncbi:hypothetical protein EAG_09238 [Camponotus floridanus]|uniref:Uncharacterized protein n=1 Tax=Camponotus floridanus TaxID=104421 RepID=E2AY24_CAMFO|nr:hypothetical protein EAG_09238 [Camponotus floridanus]